MQFWSKAPLLIFSALILNACSQGSDSGSDGMIAVVSGQQQLIRNDAEIKRVCASAFCEPNFQVSAFFGRRHSSPSHPTPVAPPLAPPPIARDQAAANYAGKILNEQQAWNRTLGDASVVVAIIDSGIDINHPDLNGHLLVNAKELNSAPGVDADHNGYANDVYGYDFYRNVGSPDDEAGHGTHVAGIITALAPSVKIMPLKFLDSRGSGGTYDAIRAIDYAIARGVQVINASWGGTSYSQLLGEAVQRAMDAGITFVAASGNSAANFDVNPNFPASFPHVISVAASDSSDSLASYSNFGSSVTIAAPGDEIVSTYPTNNYATLSGTSMASPQVAGTVALMKSVKPSLSQTEVTDQLCKTSEPILKDVTHCGRMNSGRAVIEL